LQLKPYQRVGVEFLSTHKAALLADTMGLGKTAQAAVALQNVGAKSAVIVCPASLKLNWRDELCMWGVSAERIGVAYGASLPDTDIVIINYDILDKHLNQLISRGNSVVIADEAHYMKNPSAKRTRAMLSLRGEYNWLLTGTPILNRPLELWPLLRHLDPRTWGRRRSFIERYCDPKIVYKGRRGTFPVWDTTGASNLEELAQRLQPLMLRRMKEDVLKELPDKTRQAVVFPVSSRDIKDVILQEKNLITLNSGSSINGLDKLAKLRHNLGIAKVGPALEHIKMILESEEKVVVFAHHKDVIAELKEGLCKYSPVSITGDTSIKVRHENVQRFQDDSRVRVFLGNMSAAGVGLTLTAASVAIFVEQDWTPGVMLQAEDRIHRIGQKNSALIQYLVFDGSLDARMANTVARKEAIIDKIVKPTEDLCLSKTRLNVSPLPWRSWLSWKWQHLKQCSVR